MFHGQAALRKDNVDDTWLRHASFLVRPFRVFLPFFFLFFSFSFRCLFSFLLYFRVSVTISSEATKTESSRFIFVQPRPRGIPVRQLPVKSSCFTLFDRFSLNFLLISDVTVAI